MRKTNFLKNKKGSHVGVVLSFVFFVTFLLFFYIITQPMFSVKENKNLVVDDLKKKMMNELETELKTAHVVLEEGASQDCIVLDDFFSETNLNSTIKVKTNIGQTEQAFISTPGEKDIIIQKGSVEKVFIYDSNSFEKLTKKSSAGCKRFSFETPKGYEIQTITKNTYFSEKKITDLIGEYADDYEKLKIKFGLSGADNFAIEFLYNNGTIIKSREQEVQTTVISEKISIIYIDENINIKTGELSIMVW